MKTKNTHSPIYTNTYVNKHTHRHTGYPPGGPNNFKLEYLIFKWFDQFEYSFSLSLGITIKNSTPEYIEKYKNTPILYEHKHTHIYTHTHTNTNIHTHTYAHTQELTQIHTLPSKHTNTHTHKQTQKLEHQRHMFVKRFFPL